MGTFYWTVFALSCLALVGIARSVWLDWRRWSRYLQVYGARTARMPEDFAWLTGRDEAYRAAMRLTLDRHQDRVEVLLADVRGRELHSVKVPA